MFVSKRRIYKAIKREMRKDVGLREGERDKGMALSILASMQVFCKKFDP